METLLAVTAADEGLISWAGDLVKEAKTLVSAILIVAGIVVAVMIIVKNPTVGRVITGVLVGAFIAGLPWIIPGVGGMLKGDIQASGVQPPAVVLEVSPTPHSTIGGSTPEA